MPVDEQGMYVSVGTVASKNPLMEESVPKLYNSKHKYFTFAQRTKVTFVRRTVRTFASSPFLNAKAFTQLWQVFPCAQDLLLPCYVPVKAEKLQPHPGKPVARP